MRLCAASHWGVRRVHADWSTATLTFTYGRITFGGQFDISIHLRINEVIEIMATLNAQQIAAKWAANAQAAQQAMKDGVNSVTVAPGQKAAAAKDSYVQGVTNAVNKWATNVASVSLGAWQQAMLVKGLPRVAAGVQAAVPKMQNFLTQFLPVVQQVQAQVQAMPSGNLENNIQRMVANVRGLANFQYKKNS